MMKYLGIQRDLVLVTKETMNKLTKIFKINQLNAMIILEMIG